MRRYPYHLLKHKKTTRQPASCYKEPPRLYLELPLPPPEPSTLHKKKQEKEERGVAVVDFTILRF